MCGKFADILATEKTLSVNFILSQIGFNLDNICGKCTLLDCGGHCTL